MFPVGLLVVAGGVDVVLGDDFAVFVDGVVSGAPFFFGVVVGCGFDSGGVCLLWRASA